MAYSELSDSIAFPFVFTSGGDVSVADSEKSLYYDIRSSVFVRQNSIPLFAFGSGIEYEVFEPNDIAEQAILSFKIKDSVESGVGYLDVLEEEISLAPDENKLSIVVPYSNIRTGKTTTALFSVEDLG